MGDKPNHRYHLMRLVVGVVDKFRKQEHRAFMEEGDDILKWTKYLWLWNKENIPPVVGLSLRTSVHWISRCIVHALSRITSVTSGTIKGKVG
jgi:hypothetical protein